jgi:hypothetical protein
LLSQIKQIITKKTNIISHDNATTEYLTFFNTLQHNKHAACAIAKPLIVSPMQSLQQIAN